MPTPALPSATVWGWPVDQLTAFDTAYWNSFPAAVRALRTTPQGETADSVDNPRVQLAQKLAQQGFLIDVPIMVWGWDPLVTMSARVADGFSAVPSAYQPAGGVAGPVPPGYIKVSADIADYKPAPDLVPAPSLPSGVSLVGNFEGFQIPLNGVEYDVYSVNKAKNAVHLPHFPEGFAHAENGVNFVYHMLGNEFMDSQDRVGVWLTKSVVVQ